MRLPDGHLPRLTPAAYHGTATVFWTLTLQNRATGWLTPAFHAKFREATLHTIIREPLFCPIYILMPDHIHFIWMGTAAKTDQLAAIRFLRTHLDFGDNIRLQHQPHDHILRSEKRQAAAFAATCEYIRENSVRAQLVQTPDAWPHYGSIIPGYPTLRHGQPKFWDIFWRCYNATLDRGHLGKISTPPPPM